MEARDETRDLGIGFGGRHEKRGYIQDRESDIYEQFAVVPDLKTDLLIRAGTNRTLRDMTKLFNCLADQAAMGTSQILVEVRAKRLRKRRMGYTRKCVYTIGRKPGLQLHSPARCA